MKKINVLVDDDLFEDVKVHITWGLRRHVISALLRMAVKVAKEEGQIGLAAIMEDSFEINVRLNKDAKARRS